MNKDIQGLRLFVWTSPNPQDDTFAVYAIDPFEAEATIVVQLENLLEKRAKAHPEVTGKSNAPIADYEMREFPRGGAIDQFLGANGMHLGRCALISFTGGIPAEH